MASAVLMLASDDVRGLASMRLGSTFCCVYCLNWIESTTPSLLSKILVADDRVSEI